MCVFSFRNTYSRISADILSVRTRCVGVMRISVNVSISVLMHARAFVRA